MSHLSVSMEQSSGGSMARVVSLIIDCIDRSIQCVKCRVRGRKENFCDERHQRAAARDRRKAVPRPGLFGDGLEAARKGGRRAVEFDVSLLSGRQAAAW